MYTHPKTKEVVITPKRYSEVLKDFTYTLEDAVMEVQSPDDAKTTKFEMMLEMLAKAPDFRDPIIRF